VPSTAARPRRLALAEGRPAAETTGAERRWPWPDRGPSVCPNADRRIWAALEPLTCRIRDGPGRWPSGCDISTRRWYGAALDAHEVGPRRPPAGRDPGLRGPLRPLVVRRSSSPALENVRPCARSLLPRYAQPVRTSRRQLCQRVTQAGPNPPLTGQPLVPRGLRGHRTRGSFTW